jgi:hypothetical protein
MWGKFPVETGRLVSKYDPPKVRESKGGDQSLALGAVVRRFMANKFSAYTTDALMVEQMSKPIADKNYGDVDLFGKVKREEIVTLPGFSFVLRGDDPLQKLRDYLDEQEAEPFRSIRTALDSVAQSQKNSQDAWHLHCAMIYGMDAFLTADTTLIGQVKSISDKSTRKAVLDRLRLPTELCEWTNTPPLTVEELAALAEELGAL